jgi:hypothetical protein
MIQEGKDYVLVKSSTYIEPGMVIQSGNLIVTKNRVILNVFQTLNVLEQDRVRTTGIMDSIRELKKEFKDLKANMSDTFAQLKNSKEGAEMVHYIASSAPSIEEFEDMVAGIGAKNPKSLNLARNDIKEFKIGFFKGFQVWMTDGKVHKIRTTKLSDLKNIVGAG